MELLQLKYFQVAAKLQNFSQAADKLNISQPSLSITIARLEDELKINLFDRKGRNVSLNKSGYLFLQRVNNIFYELDNAKSEISDAVEDQAKHITLSTTGARLISGILIKYIESHQDVVINQKCGLFETAKNELTSGETDFCITLPALQGENIECRILKEDELVLIVSENHRFSRQKSVKLADVADDDFVALPPYYNFREILDSACKSAGFTPKISFEVDDILVQEMIELGKGITILPSYIAGLPHIRRNRLKMIKIEEPDVHIQVGMSWLKGKHLSEAARDFRNFVIQNYCI